MSAATPFRCVISKHKDVTPFLGAQAALDAKNLQRIQAEQDARRKAPPAGAEPE